MTLHSRAFIYLMISEYFNDTVFTLSLVPSIFLPIYEALYFPLLEHKRTHTHTPTQTHPHKLWNTHTHSQRTQPWKTQSALYAGSLANELSYWNRKKSALCCRKCCYGKPYRRGTEGKLLTWTKKHDNVLLLQMYQFIVGQNQFYHFFSYHILTTCWPYLYIINYHKVPLQSFKLPLSCS